jgi:hypothetical protein
MIARTHLRAPALALALLCSLGLALAAPVPAGAAGALTITSPSQGSSTSSLTPGFSGSTGDLEDAVTLELFSGEDTQGLPLQTLPAVLDSLTGDWAASGTLAVGPGTYTAVAVQSPEGQPPAFSQPVTFTVDIAAPLLSVLAPPQFVDDSTPSLQGAAGTEPGDQPAVSVTVHAGSTPAGAVVGKGPALVSGATWSFTAPQLQDGTYTVAASQRDAAGNVGHSANVTFVIDTTAPAVSVTAPANGAVLAGLVPAFAGTAGEEPGDVLDVTLRILADGPGRTETPVAALEGLSVSGGAWSVAGNPPNLPVGLYTVLAEQRDAAGNVGDAEPVTFAVTAAATGPTASFQWFPAAPHTGEAVSLVSTSAGSGSPIAALSWGLDGGPTAPGTTVQTVSFATPGAHSVRLTVTDAHGLSSAAEQTIHVLGRTTQVMQPFPIVRIAGVESRGGASLRLLSVEANVGAKVLISCHGSGCPTRLLSTVAGGSARPPATGTVVLRFHRFQRALRAGVTLEIRVSQGGQIGKYTRFSIRRGKLPVRFDSCLDPLGKTPIACPSS